MNERLARELLLALRTAIRQMALYPQGHPTTAQVLERAREAAEVIAKASGGEAVLTFIGDSIYLGRQVLAHASLEFNRFLRELQARGIESLTFISPVSRADLADLAAFIAGVSGDLPAEGTVRLNESPYTRADLEVDSALADLRRSYARTLDVLRGVALAVDSDQPFDLSGATWAVEQLVEQTLAQPGASLLLSTLKSHDEYTFYHSVNVCVLSIALGRLVGFDKDDLRLLGVGALLHDIGKVAVEAATLQYPGRLSSTQWNQIKLHPQEGAEAIMAAAGPAQEVASVVAFEHHARFDQSGYPQIGYRTALHYFSRLVATVDTYDAITTRRSYRRAETPNRALRVLLKGAGGMYDPDFVQAFISLVGVYPPGSLLELDTGDVVMVVRSNEDEPLPEAVLVQSGGVLLDHPEPVSLEGRAILEQLTPDRVGIEPASLLEQVGVVEDDG